MATEFRHEVMNNISYVMDSKLKIENSDFSARCTSGSIRLLQGRANELAGKTRLNEIERAEQRKVYFTKAVLELIPNKFYKYRVAHEMSYHFLTPLIL